MSWPPKTPYLATDGIVEIYDESYKFMGIVLIERKNEPLGLALPGGFVDIGESVEDAVVREMKEEISLDVHVDELLGIYSDPARDSRFHVASAVYICKAIGTPKGADDAKEARVFALDKLPLDDLVFDHKKILLEYLQYSTSV
ncbi:MAG: NUDIX hydrolase [Sulfurimonas sp.]|uniref:NUDIX hydrolase n=1 Tax=Sulfurimonas sp. TaxID=2022749 RepID=UPI00261DD9A5|nr:NUDIX hydrolase [Sulfurimonas sp.]MCW8896256.1 NUDIX hydrolase [Sulfurimonas sp.]MCW8953573.1 NUDIX hydrolase [Sulfurimonas sp.]MCW9067380.1 NUDIX hydrolase [Sulfurimonas sp.]